MNDMTIGLEQTEEVMLTSAVSDEALESAAASGEKAGNYTLIYCTALDLCPAPKQETHSAAHGCNHCQIGRSSMKLLILVVDDEPDVEMLFRQQFRHDIRAGRFTMEFAPSAPAALERVADATGVSIILILSDINMPGMSGLEMLPKAKALRPDVPVIMITAYGDAETKQKALANGAEALLTKPIDFALLRNEIDTRVPRAA